MTQSCTWFFPQMNPQSHRKSQTIPQRHSHGYVGSPHPNYPCKNTFLNQAFPNSAASKSFGDLILQMVQNTEKCLILQQPRQVHITWLLIELNLPPVAAGIKFETPMLTSRILAGSAPHPVWVDDTPHLLNVNVNKWEGLFVTFVVLYGESGFSVVISPNTSGDKYKF